MANKETEDIGREALADIQRAFPTQLGGGVETVHIENQSPGIADRIKAERANPDREGGRQGR